MGMKRPRKFKKSTVTVKKITKIARRVAKRELASQVELKIQTISQAVSSVDGDFIQLQVGTNNFPGGGPSNHIGGQIQLKGLKVRYSSAYLSSAGAGFDDIVQTHIYVVEVHNDALPSGLWYKDNNTEDVLGYAAVVGTDKINTRKNVVGKYGTKEGAYTILGSKVFRQSNGAAQTAGLARYRTGTMFVKMNKRMKYKVLQGSPDPTEISPFIYVIMYSVSTLQTRVLGTLNVRNQVEGNYYYTDS